MDTKNGIGVVNYHIEANPKTVGQLVIQNGIIIKKQNTI